MGKLLYEVVEHYEVPRERAVLPTPGWDGWAGGGNARRFWIHDRVLVGGAILGQQDAAHLRNDYGVTHVCSFEAERLDHGLGWPHANLCWSPFIDIGAPIHPALLRQALDFCADSLSDPQCVLYAHCQQGGGRGPSLGYMIVTGLLGQVPEDVLARLRTIPGVNPHPNYVASIDEAILAWRSKKGGAS